MDLRKSLIKRDTLLKKLKLAIRTRDFDTIGTILEDLIKQIYT